MPVHFMPAPDTVIIANFYPVSWKFSAADTPLLVSDDAAQSPK